MVMQQLQIKINKSLLVLNALLTAACIFFVLAFHLPSKGSVVSSKLMIKYGELQRAKMVINKFHGQLICRHNVFAALYASLQQLDMHVISIKQTQDDWLLTLQTTRLQLMQWLQSNYFARRCVIPVFVEIKVKDQKWMVQLKLKGYSNETIS